MCYRRDSNEKGELVADLDLDYVPVAVLIGHIAAEGAGIAVSNEVLETINAVKIATVKIPTDDGATAYEVGKLLKLDKSAAWRRLRVAMEKGFVVNLEQHKNRPGKYRLTDQEVEAEALLPSVEEIRAYQALSAERGQKSAQPRNRTPKDEEDQRNSGCTDARNADNGGATAKADANGSCNHQPSEKADEMRSGCTFARKADPIPGGGNDHDQFTNLKDEKWRLR